MLELLHKQVMCCICPINDTDTINMQMRINPGFKNVQCETSVYEYTGWIDYRGLIMSSVKCEIKKCQSTMSVKIFDMQWKKCMYTG